MPPPGRRRGDRLFEFQLRPLIRLGLEL
jgi:hypothetical protein